MTEYKGKKKKKLPERSRKKEIQNNFSIVYFIFFGSVESARGSCLMSHLSAAASQSPVNRMFEFKSGHKLAAIHTHTCTAGKGKFRPTETRTDSINGLYIR